MTEVLLEVTQHENSFFLFKIKSIVAEGYREVVAWFLRWFWIFFIFEKKFSPLFFPCKRRSSHTHSALFSKRIFNIFKWRWRYSNIEADRLSQISIGHLEFEGTGNVPKSEAGDECQTIEWACQPEKKFQRLVTLWEWPVVICLSHLGVHLGRVHRHFAAGGRSQKVGGGATASSTLSASC